MSELDQSHRQKLITFLKKFEQVFITATRLEVSDANHYQLKKKQKEAF
jgi:recombinational DNA repair ATPase RecF